MRLQSSLLVVILLLVVPAAVQAAEADRRGALALQPHQLALHDEQFSSTAYGNAPAGWRQLEHIRPSRNWAVDGNGFLRVMLKRRTGLIVYAGALPDGSRADALADVIIDAEFKKVEDEDASFGLVGRLKDENNYYLARFVGGDMLELHKVAAGETTLLSRLVTWRRYREGEAWRMTLALRGTLITATLVNADGEEMARVDGKDTQLPRGAVGLRCTTYAAARSSRIRAFDEFKPALTGEQITRHNSDLAALDPQYPLVRPHPDRASLQTPLERVGDRYDVIVAGAGTGGTAAAIQAARLGAKVLLVESTDWIGGQMAAVPTMDEALGPIPPVRERGFYREFLESLSAYYYTLGKDPFKGERSFGEPQSEAGFEPRIAQAVLYGFIGEANQRRGAGRTDLVMRSTVAAVRKSGDTITGVTLASDTGQREKQVACKILIDATEYGDVIPLTGARYRAGTATSDRMDLSAPVQDNTWPAVIREYPGGVPERLRITSPPPNYDTIRRPYSKYFRWGSMFWGRQAQALGLREFQYPLLFFYRANADTDSPLTGRRSELRITQAEINGGNDYPVLVSTLEDPAQRLRDERDGIYRSMCAVYYFQHELGLNWALAEDEGFNTPYNQAMMKRRELRADLEKLAVYLPQQPYVRESRRIIGINTLVANDLGRFENEKLMATSLAMGDYFMDLHNTYDAIEMELDGSEHPRGGGPFQVPFESFVPEKIDGFLAAEKNISQSRLVNGATRMQPITMLTGQAAGTIAALAVRHNVQPRQLDPKQVQAVQLQSGSTLIQRWYADVPWATPIWRATQLLSLYEVMDRAGPFMKERSPLGSKARWGVSEPLTNREVLSAVTKLAQLKGMPTPPRSKLGAPVSHEKLAAYLASVNASWSSFAASAKTKDEASVTAGEFALIAAQILLDH